MSWHTRLMPWRGRLLVAVLIAAFAAHVATDTGARLLISGPVDITNGSAFGVEIGNSEGIAVATLRRRFGEPTVIQPEPAPRFRIRPYESYAFRDPGPFAGVISLDVRDGYVFRIRATYIGFFG